MRYNYTCEVIKYRDKTNGNTYHACRITRHRDGQELRCPLTYGYGSHYKQTAREALKRAAWDDCMTDNILWIVNDGLKRDALELGGK